MIKDIDEMIKHIETKYPVEEIKYDDMPIWPFLRFNLFSIWFDKISNSENPLIISNTEKKDSRIGVFKKFLKCFFHSYLPFYFCKNKTLYFVNEPSFRKIGDKVDDRIGGGLFKTSKDIIPVVPNSISDKEYPFKRYVSSYFLSKLARINRVDFDYKKLSAQGVFDSILNELNINYDLKSFVITLLRYIKMYDRWFSIIKPKKIIVACYYITDRMAAFYVAKKKNILVIELQHGMFGKSHIAYNLYKEIFPNPYPDKLLVFGENFKTLVSPNLYKPMSIFSNGNYYLDYVRDNIENNKHEFCQKYGLIQKKVITVASQITVDRELFDYFVSFAQSNTDFLIFYIPREREMYHNIELPENFIIEWDFDVYKCMQNSDVTVTVYSTCCFESLALGVPALLLDINGFATLYMKEYLTSDTTLEICRTDEDIVLFFDKLLKKKKSSILEEGDRYYSSNHLKLLAENL